MDQRSIDGDVPAGALSLLLRPVLTLADRRLLALDVVPRLSLPGQPALEGVDIWAPLNSRRDIDKLSAVFSEALARHFRQWQASDLAARLSIAVSLKAMQHQLIQRCLFEQLSGRGVPPEMLEFRISEAQLVDDVHGGFALADQVRRQGASVAVGVFGAAHARYAAVAELPFDALWISPAFVARIKDKGVARDAVLDAIAFGESRHMPVIAQGIDSEDDWEHLMATPCSAAQGDWLAPALAPQDLLDWLQARPDMAPATAAMPGGGQPGRRALIVDDDPLIRQLLERQLGQLGFGERVAAGDGAEARRVLDADTDFAVIFCDLQMPGMDGVEFLRHAAERIPQINVVLVSGVDAKIMRSAAALAQAHHLKLLGTLTKPVRLDTLRGLVQRLDRHEAVQGAPPRIAVTLPELKAALASETLQAWFQPQVAVASGELWGVEALARWVHPQGVLTPPQFLPLAQQGGLTAELTWRMLHDALSAQARWREQGLRLTVSVNLTMEVLTDLNFPERLSGMCAAHGVPAESLKLEITESSAMQDPVTTLDVVTRLRMRDFALAIDDFGTGFSSLSQLREIPFNQLKIDQSFVSISHLDGEARRIVESNIRLARSLDMQSVAEGVEAADDWRLLRELGCDALQGFFVSPALAPEALLDWANGDYARRLASGELPPV